MPAVCPTDGQAGLPHKPQRNPQVSLLRTAGAVDPREGGDPEHVLCHRQLLPYFIVPLRLLTPVLLRRREGQDADAHCRQRRGYAIKQFLVPKDYR